MQLACYTEKEEGNSKCLWETVSGPANPIQMAPYLIPSIYCHRRQPAASTTTVKPAFSNSNVPNKHILTLKVYKLLTMVHRRFVDLQQQNRERKLTEKLLLLN